MDCVPIHVFPSTPFVVGLRYVPIPFNYRRTSMPSDA